jgi:hypothetical protein
VNASTADATRNALTRQSGTCIQSPPVDRQPPSSDHHHSCCSKVKGSTADAKRNALARAEQILPFTIMPGEHQTLGPANRNPQTKGMGSETEAGGLGSSIIIFCGHCLLWVIVASPMLVCVGSCKWGKHGFVGGLVVYSGLWFTMFNLSDWSTVTGFLGFLGGPSGLKRFAWVTVLGFSFGGVGLWWNARRERKRQEKAQARRARERAEDEARRRSRYQKEPQKTPNGKGSTPPPDAAAPDAKIHPSQAFWREYDKLLKSGGRAQRPDGGRSSSRMAGRRA